MSNGFVLLADGFDGLMIGKIDAPNWTMFPFGIAALFLGITWRKSRKRLE